MNCFLSFSVYGHFWLHFALKNTLVTNLYWQPTYIGLCRKHNKLIIVNKRFFNLKLQSHTSCHNMFLLWESSELLLNLKVSLGSCYMCEHQSFLVSSNTYCLFSKRKKSISNLMQWRSDCDVGVIEHMWRDWQTYLSQHNILRSICMQNFIALKLIGQYCWSLNYGLMRWQREWDCCVKDFAPSYYIKSIFQRIWFEL